MGALESNGGDDVRVPLQPKATMAWRRASAGSPPGVGRTGASTGGQMAPWGTGFQASDNLPAAASWVGVGAPTLERMAMFSLATAASRDYQRPCGLRR
ncbi:MAG: hypothetical protein LC721_01955 [Actinobacteria bacterium]|nr:hypothetical protein [Actinomycetota bacterium]